MPEVTRVDFYIVDEADDTSWLRLACRLTEKAFLQSHKVCIAVDSPADADVMDKLLWTFRDRSFIPHEVVGAKGFSDEPVQITASPPPAQMNDVLLNLRREVPEEFTRFQRVVEPLDGDATRRKEGRARFKHYRDQGITPASHNLSIGQDS